VTDLFQEPEDATPLEPGEREGLLQTWVTHRRDLNEAEQENILRGALWARRQRRLGAIGFLDTTFILQLHSRLFGDVWEWAGRFRRTERNIGIPAYRIGFELEAMLGDIRYWVEHATFPPDEIAVRLHHKLVAIHPFPNGNGRHARLMADLLIEKLGGKPFSWGGGSLADMGELRGRYVAALRSADAHDIVPLLFFARS
jgi:Fic-DOC domain mobile mystery protein B